MKPDAPDDVRGKFKPIKTNVPGIQICEHFPLMARMMDKVALIRSLHHNTGAIARERPALDDDRPRLQPRRHQAARRQRDLPGVRSASGDLPANVILPGTIGNTGAGPLHGQTAGYLGSAHEPFFLNADPAPADFKVGDLEVAAGPDRTRASMPGKPARAARRLAAPHRDQRPRWMHDTSYARAFRLLTSPRGQEGVRPGPREQTSSAIAMAATRFGQSCLMARRLIEAGARYVTVNHFDTVFNHVLLGHARRRRRPEQHLPRLRTASLPAVRLGVHGPGRRPGSTAACWRRRSSPCSASSAARRKLNDRGGRDHYPPAWTNFLCGGNIRGGQVIGSTDKIGAAPRRSPDRTAADAGLDLPRHGHRPGHRR